MTRHSAVSGYGQKTKADHDQFASPKTRGTVIPERVHANCANTQPARRLTIEATIDLARSFVRMAPSGLPLARQLERSGYGHGSGDLGR